MEIYNLVPAEFARRKHVPGTWEGSTEDSGDAQGPEHFLRLLKDRLKCATHTTRYCYISPANGEHVHLDNFKLSLWAKKISEGSTTVTAPPNMPDFDFVPHRPRRAPINPPPPPPNTPVIHVHLPSTLMDHPHRLAKAPTHSASMPNQESGASNGGHIAELLVDIDRRFPGNNIAQFIPNFIIAGHSSISHVAGMEFEVLLALTGDQFSANFIQHEAIHHAQMMAKLKSSFATTD